MIWRSMLAMSTHTLVLGGTGKTGRRIVERLRARDVSVRVGSRALPFDWYDASTWEGALDDVSAAYVSFFPDLAMEGAPELIGAFARLAASRGVERLVLLSGRGEPEAQRAEQELIAAGTAWTVVRCSWFAQNFSEAFLLDAVRAGEIALPAGDVPEPFVDADDIADVAVAALTDDRHVNRLYEVTGPRALSFAEAVGEIAAAAKRPIKYVQITPDDFVVSMRPYAPEDIVQLLHDLFTVVLDGRNTPIAHGVEEALGRPARDFSDYVRRTAAAGTWSA
jgi:uncharacterized protein YbjT (DUF2867 family)